ncbi:putative dehydrogenase [Melghirimyces profundicolus]|uniref:Putative dehydrogenase n=1 Tax=Melghirimyces profundicolus TaxID=1242148 RepID=A0A2T6AV33_9BACL|nr:putative dehydrogenase [Melghirimyces profundicolus]
MGAGNIARRYHIKGYVTSSEADIVAVTDIVKDVAEQAASEYGITKVYDDFQELLQDDTIDAISICVPNQFHAPITIAALEAGKHVLVEKPVALNLGEAYAMREAAQKNNAIVMVEYPMRFDSGYLKAKRLIDEGYLGDIVLVKGTWCHGGPEMYTKGKWFFSKELAGGGSLIDLGVHSIDILRWLIGDIKDVTGFCSTLTKSIKVEDNAIISLQFKNGTLGLVDTSWSVRSVQVRTEIYGTKGRLLLQDSPVTSIEADFADDLHGKLIIAHTKDTGDNDPHVKCVRHFVRCIAEGMKPDTATLDDGIAALEVIMNVYENNYATKKGNPV